MRIETQESQRRLEQFSWKNFLDIHQLCSTQLEKLRQRAIASTPPFNPDRMDITLRKLEWLKSVMEHEERTVTHKMMNIIYESIKILSSTNIEHSATNPAYSEQILCYAFSKLKEDGADLDKVMGYGLFGQASPLTFACRFNLRQVMHCLLLLGSNPNQKIIPFNGGAAAPQVATPPVSYTHLTLPPTPYV